MRMGRAAMTRNACLLRKHLAVMIVVSAAFTSPVTATEADGEHLFTQCKTCHDVGPGARHKVGPHLDGVAGRVAGSIRGFRYSGAMRAAGAAGLTWSTETLDAYLIRPREFVPGNRMSFRGMANLQDRKALIDWLLKSSTAAPSKTPAAPAADNTKQPGSFADIVLTMEGDREYGEYLSGECVTCHQPSGRADGIPSIVGIPRDYFVRALFEYKSNVRRNDVMQLRAANLGNEEIAALARYFSSLEPQ